MNEIRRIAAQQQRLSDLARNPVLDAMRKQAAMLQRMSEPMQAVAAQAEVLRQLQRSPALAAAQAASTALRAVDTAQLSRSVDAVFATRSSIQQIADVMRGSAAAAAETQLRAVDAIRPRLIDLLPDITALIAQAQEFHNVQEALKAAGFDALAEPLPFYVFKGIDTVDERVRSAWLTTRLIQLSKTDDFTRELETAFLGSVILRDRWPVVAEALAVHQEGRYLLSIPALLAQTEGVVGDALVLKGIVRPIKGKLYVKDVRGRRQRNSAGQFVTISGASELAARARKLDHETLNSVADYMTTIFVGSRNQILHGRKPKYRSPKLSVQSVFALYMLSGAVREFEERT